MSVCLRMNHLRISRGCVSACDAFVLRQGCKRVVRVSMGCFSFGRGDAEMSAAGPLPNNYCHSPPKSIENLQQQQQEEETEEMTPVSEFDDIEAGMIEDIEELYKTEKEDDDDHVVKMDNNGD